MAQITTYPKRGGFYFVGKKPYVSVTEVLKVMDKPALRYWYGTEVFYAMVKNPTLSKEDALSSPYKKTQSSILRGRTVHSIVESYKKTGNVIDTVPDEFKGYAKSFYKWVDENKIEILANEKTVISEKHGYGGTLDLYVKINGKGPYVVDVKTGKEIYDEASLQLSAYQSALIESNLTAPHIAVLLLSDTGIHTFKEVQPCFDEFLACKRLWEWKNKDLVKKVNGL